MRRDDYVFCMGFEGGTAIVDGRLRARYAGATTRRLAEAGLFKQAISSAMFAGSDEELAEVLALFNSRTGYPVATAADLKRIFGTFAPPEGTIRIQVV